MLKTTLIKQMIVTDLDELVRMWTHLKSKINTADHYYYQLSQPLLHDSVYDL